MKTTYACANCGALVERQPSAVVGKVFCSRACTHAANKGQPSPHRGKRGPDSVCWQGGRYNKHGYWYVWTPTGYVQEHRLVVEQTLGRSLLSNEHVHHINHDKGDNRPENLMVLSPSAHARLTQAEIAADRGWAEQWTACVSCGTTERRHYGQGLCVNCYMREHMRRKREAGYIAPSRRKPPVSRA